LKVWWTVDCRQFKTSKGHFRGLCYYN